MLIADICGTESIFAISCQIRDGLLKSINYLQNRVVDDMEQQLREFAEHGGFATASIATFFAPTRSFVMCNIGNPPPLIFRAADRSWDVFHGEQQQVSPDEPIEGVFTKGEYRFIETKLDVGDHFFIYGNGFAQSKFPDGDIVGHSRLLSALQDASHTGPEQRIEHLVGRVREANETSEDSTVISCSVTNQSVGLRDNLLVRFAYSVAQKITQIWKKTDLVTDRSNPALSLPANIVCFSHAAIMSPAFISSPNDIFSPQFP